MPSWLDIPRDKNDLSEKLGSDPSAVRDDRNDKGWASPDAVDAIKDEGVDDKEKD